jgi:hypothetical protein
MIASDGIIEEPRREYPKFRNRRPPLPAFASLIRCESNSIRRKRLLALHANVLIERPLRRSDCVHAGVPDMGLSGGFVGRHLG